MYDKKFDIVVVTTRRRKSLITSYLDGLNPIISVTPDYCLPENFEPTVEGLTHNHLGTYRCFKGHQDAIAKTAEDKVLIFEDDAIPNRPDWWNIVNESAFLLDTFDMISFHGRAYDEDAFEPVENTRDHEFLRASNENTWVVAALAYMVDKKNYERLKSLVYDGTPWDLVLYRQFSYCLMKKSPFDHDRSEGSLVD